MDNDGKNLKKIMTVITVIITILLVAFIIYAVKMNLLTSPELLVGRIKSYGLIGPIIFLLLQIVLVSLGKDYIFQLEFGDTFQVAAHQLLKKY